MGAIQAIRGTRDILPPETDYWQWVEAIAGEWGAQRGGLPLIG